ncbi:MAG: hypothetical protein IKL55_02125 [Clostridia bacterium]|nr:hypothetical protein [Clostridia bacterium]
MSERIVFELRVPSCAKVKDVKFIPKYNFVAATMEYEGRAITFLRTDFLEFKPEAWDYAEKFSDTQYSEVIPEVVTESIKKCGGIYISRDFHQTTEDGKRWVTSGGKTRKGMSYVQAECLAALGEIPEMESSLIYGVVYDMIGKWLIATESLTEEEWAQSPESVEKQNEILNRDCGGWTIKELLGDIFQFEWTKERFEQKWPVARCGIPHDDGERKYPARKRYAYKPDMYHSETVARTMWYFK